MVLFVTSLYTNIPITDVFNIIKDYANNADQFTRKTAIPQENFLDLVYLVLTTIWCTFDSQFYQQTDVVAMEGPTSSTTPEIYIQAHEKTLISTALHRPRVSEQFVDNVYSFLNVITWKTFFITSTIFIKTLSLLWGKKVMEN